MPRNPCLKIGDIVAKGNLKVVEQKTIIEGDSKTKRGYSRVECKLCGNNTKWMRNCYLKTKKATSCGCSTHDSSKWESIGPKNMPWQLPEGESAFNNLYHSYKVSAERRGYSFNLSQKQFRKLTKELCFYCGIEPHKIIKGQGKTSGDYIYNGIDRIDNNKGYTKNNVVSCCFNCNSAKRELSQEDFFILISNIYHRHIHK